MKRVSITADDYGVHPDFDKAIEACIDAGTIDNVSIFTTYERAYDRIRQLSLKYRDKIEEGKLGLGLHLALSTGDMQSDNDKIKDYFTEYGTRRFRNEHLIDLNDFFDPAINQYDFIDAFTEEIHAQANRFFELTGMPPMHLTSHQGFFQITPSSLKAMCRVAAGENTWKYADHTPFKMSLRHPTFIYMRDEIEFNSIFKSTTPKMVKRSRQGTLGLRLLLKGGYHVNKFVFGIFDEEPKMASIYTQKRAELDVVGPEYQIETYYNARTRPEGKEKLMNTILDQLPHHPMGSEVIVHPIDTDFFQWEEENGQVITINGINPGRKNKLMVDRYHEFKALTGSKLSTRLNLEPSERGFNRFIMVHDHEKYKESFLN